MRAHGSIRVVFACVAVLLIGLVFGNAEYASGQCCGSTTAEAGDVSKKIVSLGRNGSQVMNHLGHLTNRIGPRPSGSKNLQAACEWARDRFADFGLSNVHLEKCGELPAGKDEDPSSRKEPVPLYNVVADLPGSVRPDEYVIVGAHIDSLDAGTGAADNGSGVAAVMEAARILAESGARPRRTVRFILFPGEEIGLYGSNGYVKAHASLMPKVSAMLNMDQGAGYINGIKATDAMMGDFETVFASVKSLDPERPFSIERVDTLPKVDPNCCGGGARTVQPACGPSCSTSGVAVGSSDHAPFLAAGVPSFLWNQSDPEAYWKVLYSRRDTYDHVDPGDLKHSAIVISLSALGIANLDHLISRDLPVKESILESAFSKVKEALSALNEGGCGCGSQPPTMPTDIGGDSCGESREQSRPKKAGGCCGEKTPPPCDERGAQSGMSTGIPFELIRNHIILPVEIKDKKFRLILDTGMPVDGVILFDQPKAMSLGFNAPVRIAASGEGCSGGSGGATCVAVPGTLTRIRLSGVELEDQIVTVIEAGPALGRYLEAEGIIGYALFSRFTVEIDHEAKVVRLHDPETFQYSGGGREFPIPLNEYGIPEVSCRADLTDGRTIPLQLVVDTGAAHALSLHAGTKTGIPLPEKAIEFTLGRSLYGEVLGHIGRIRSLHLGEFELKNMVTSFTSDPGHVVTLGEKQGNLGNAALRRFNVVFDYGKGRMILEPNRRLEDPFEFNMAGMACTRAESGAFRIDKIIPASPAGDARLMENDLVVEINGRKADEITTDEFQLLLQEEGAFITLGLLRGGEHKEVRLKLRRLI